MSVGPTGPTGPRGSTGPRGPAGYQPLLSPVEHRYRYERALGEEFDSSMVYRSIYDSLCHMTGVTLDPDQLWYNITLKQDPMGLRQQIEVDVVYPFQARVRGFVADSCIEFWMEEFRVTENMRPPQDPRWSRDELGPNEPRLWNHTHLSGISTPAEPRGIEADVTYLDEVVDEQPFQEEIDSRSERPIIFEEDYGED